MPRLQTVQVLRGVAANMPSLGDGEFYFSTDEYQLYVGFNGDALPVGGTMSVTVADSVNPAQKLAVASDGSIAISIASALKTAVLKTGQLVTTAVTVNQSILSYTVTVGKTLFLEYIDMQGRLTAVSATASVLGTVVVQIGGVTVFTGTFVNPTTSDAGSQSIRLMLGEPIPLPAGSVVTVLVTPAAVTSMTWTANLGGYEK